jgi:hypothetical protein
VISDVFGMALSDATCAALRKFVAAGGTVVADLCPALYDERGRLRDKGGLDDLFGVTRDQLQMGTRATDWLVWGAQAREPGLALPADGWYIAEYWEKGLKVADGKALGAHIYGGDAPAFVLKKTGAGHALLLSYAGVTPPARVTDAGHRTPWGYPINRFRDGDNYYLGVYRISDTPSVNSDEIIVDLPRRGYVYLAGGVVDAGNGVMQKTAYLGATDQPKVTLKGGGSALLAVLPYQVQGLSMALPAGAHLGDRVRVPLKLATSAPPGRHVVHVTVTDPTGMVSPLYSGNVTLAAGAADYYLPLALNDQPGAWTVTAREAVSGQQATGTIKVSQP